ncbi:hypothetical protein ISN44_As10g012380 [Arabidopsis suecica]|uniref:Transposase MuDR plant domain-containing protein n=1 Tax=Arabidopsis suecica TaxID=45249 RepID=A0A8T1ZUF7_ARASU|nr:hypothetical protein ISN44_As10g012380 [Arabidopsis suecica]
MLMEIPVFIMVGDWIVTEEKWKFEPEKGSYGRCVRVRENMTYTDLARTLCEVFNLKYKEWQPIISYWMPGNMSIMIERTRPPVYIDNQTSLDTFFLIRVGDPSVNLFVSFSRTVDATNADVDEQTDDEKTNEDAEDEENEEVDGEELNDSDENIEKDDDVSGGYSAGSTLDPTIDGSEGSGEDYDFNKWNDLIVKEYGVSHFEEDVCDIPPTVEPAGEFSRLLAECTTTSQRVRTGEIRANLGDTQLTMNSTRTCQHGLLQCTYTRECVRDTGCEGEFVTYTDTDVNGRDEVNGEIGVDLDIGGSETGVLNETDLRIQPSVESYEVYNGFSLLHSGEPEILDNDAAPVFDDLAKVRCDSTEVEISTTGETLYVGSVFMNRQVIQQTMAYLALKVCFYYKQTRSDPRRLEMACVDDNCRWHLSAKVVKNSECFKITSENNEEVDEEEKIEGNKEDEKKEDEDDEEKKDDDKDDDYEQ